MAVEPKLAATVILLRERTPDLESDDEEMQFLAVVDFAKWYDDNRFNDDFVEW